MNLFYSRELFRQFLGSLTCAVIQKHKPIIIAVISQNMANQIRNKIYESLRYQDIPVRQNIEETTAEFSIPLSIFKYDFYPSNLFEWIKIIIRVIYGQLTIKPYKHIIVIDIHLITPKIINFWLKILNPIVIFTDKNYSFLPKSSKIIDLRCNNNCIDEDIKKTLHEIFHTNQSVQSTGDINYSKYKIYRLLIEEKDKYVIDATYFFYPSKIDTIIEIAIALGRNITIITTLKKIKSKYKSQNSIKFASKLSTEIKKNSDVIVFIDRQDRATLLGLSSLLIKG